MAVQMDFEPLRRHGIDFDNNTEHSDMNMEGHKHLHMYLRKGDTIFLDMGCYAEGIAFLTTWPSTQSTPSSCCPS